MKLRTGEGCMKCGSRNADKKDVSMTGSGLSKVFDVQHNRFTVVYCQDCGYSEFYNTESSTASNVFDLFFGG
ncbi:zinc ribbon domain-containing protein [Oceanobacillus sp. M60]